MPFYSVMDEQILFDCEQMRLNERNKKKYDEGVRIMSSSLRTETRSQANESDPYHGSWILIIPIAE